MKKKPWRGGHRKARADESLGMPRISLVYLSTFIAAGFRKYQKVLALQAGSATVKRRRLELCLRPLQEELGP